MPPKKMQAMPTARFSEKIERLEKQLEPYFARVGGLKADAPPEAKKLFEEYKKQVMKEAWLDDFSQ